jgi:hypothetical protein
MVALLKVIQQQQKTNRCRFAGVWEIKQKQAIDINKST